MLPRAAQLPSQQPYSRRHCRSSVLPLRAPAPSALGLGVRPSALSPGGGAISHATAEEALALIAQHTEGAGRSRHLCLLMTASWQLVQKELAKLVALRPRNDLHVLCVDADAHKQFTSSLQVNSLPTLLFIGKDASKPCISVTGPMSAAMIRDVLDTKMELSELAAARLESSKLQEEQGEQKAVGFSLHGELRRFRTLAAHLTALLQPDKAGMAQAAAGAVSVASSECGEAV
ncbi:thioredoxin [Haematococcus lacustris]|uniref:Thioredoxin n=1 Tax=Haematococcus lacustris TaxID=44745 RepID=A0A699YGW6_HAELA|nr:thioredoxin [Haematococcus lacustris]